MTEGEMRDRMERGWASGLPETPCGRGSTLEATASVRAWLPALVARYGIRTVCDAGAGDLGWIRYVDWSVAYRPFDLVPRHPEVMPIDITSQQLPACDLILCRAVLNHLGPVQVHEALVRFRRAGRYLLATQYEAAGVDRWADWNEYDLRGFGLGEPVEACQDVPGTLALWEF